MHEALRKQVKNIKLIEHLLNIEERFYHGNLYLIGYPKPGHIFYGRVACFIWHQESETSLSGWQGHGEFPQFLTSSRLINEITIEDVEKALEIMEGL